MYYRWGSVFSYVKFRWIAGEARPVCCFKYGHYLPVTVHTPEYFISKQILKYYYLIHFVDKENETKVNLS